MHELSYRQSKWAECSKRLFTPAHPRRAKTRPFPSEAAGEVNNAGVPIFYPPNLSRPRPALTHGYVEDVDEPRTKVGKERVSARLGQGG